jgi:homoserine kinase
MPAADTVRVRVPASTSNCGPGFDTLGLALDLGGEVQVGCLAREGPLRVHGPGADHDPWLTTVAREFFLRAGLPPEGHFEVGVDAAVPRGRGLGSSAVVRVGLLAGLNRLCAGPLDALAIAAAATRLEGHPDNAAAAVFGGLCVSRTADDHGCLLDVQRILVDEALALVTLLPAVEVGTETSRRALPDQVPFAAAARSLNSLAFLVAAFAARDYRRLRDAVDDRLHEPVRLPGIPGAVAAIRAGVEAGAITGWLSGSGSGVMCLAEPMAAGAVEAAMARAFTDAGHPARSLVLHADNIGLRFVDAG